MNCYIDSSVILRILLGQNAVKIDFNRYNKKISSELLMIECNRVIDRYRLEGLLTDKQISEVKQNLRKITDGMYIIEITEAVKRKAAESFPTVIGTLDAIHISTALLWNEHEKENDIILASYDKQMCVCAKALGFEIVE